MMEKRLIELVFETKENIMGFIIVLMIWSSLLIVPMFDKEKI